ncbi:glycosyltransferase [Paraburkholderia diazotrophica]|uniref:Glycosyltransferase involved in cell wall bisynthesis n=1 Tax=Paraburkholderia diazotrophica TaxID=667676 RepID=A0A1H7E5S6_9BURK|nr:glycosyltransferase [Paraburkholderia diazotrophica]SEK06980.1 Glycosyltransferase involved in cell wall bisynthesis [Paraburkholderia diazotrophica]
MKKKIVHVTEALGGGVLHCVVLLANLQARAGDDIVIVHSIRPDTPSPDRLDALLDARIKRRVISMHTGLGVHDFAALARLMVQLMIEQADIVHLHSSKAGALGRIAARLLCISDRVVYSPHGFAFLRRDISLSKARALISIERWLHKLGGVLVGCSRSEARYATMLFSTRRVTVVENAIDLRDFGTSATDRDNTTPIICTSARVTYQKAPWRFSALAASLSNRRKVHFLWLGGGDPQAVEAWIDHQHVELSGWIDADSLRRRLNACDVFVLPSLWEGMPIALIEAQAAGLPAVASRIVGNRDVIIHGVTGFLANNDDELSAYTRRLLDDPSLRARMGAAAREHALARFNSEHFLDEFSKVYDALAKTTAYRRRRRARPGRTTAHAEGYDR